MTKKLDAPIEQASQASTIALLQQQVAMLSNQLNRVLGIPQITDRGEIVQHDFVEFGSPEQAALLGLLSVDDPATLLEGEPTYESPTSGKLYKLEDPITPFLNSSNPRMVAEMTLRMKVHAFEAGAPTIPANAPLLMTFDDPDLRSAMQIGATVL